MNVLSIIYHPIYSGPHNRVSIVAKLLEKDGVKTTVVLPQDASSAADRMRAKGVEVLTMPLHRVRASRDLHHHSSWIANLRQEVHALARLISERQIDVVATNSLPNLHGGLAARRANAACVWQLIDTFPPPIARWALMPVVLNLSDVIMTTGERVAHLHPGTTRRSGRWVPFFPCVDVDRFSASPEVRTSVRTELGFGEGDFVVGNIAAISPMKGHKYFIEAAALLRRTHPGVRFLILGSQNSERESYNASLWAKARDLGLVIGKDLVVVDPGSRVADLAQAMDIFWMTSEPNSEGIPTAIGEAKSLSIPVIAADVGSTRECVTHGSSGYLVAPRDTAAFARYTRLLVQDHTARYRFGATARREALDQFSSQNGADAHKDAYERAVRFHRKT